MLSTREASMYRSLNIALALVLAAAASAAVAQYPVKPIRLIVGFPPGGSADPTTRIMGAALAEQLGQPVVVENRPGADSAIAAEQVTRLPADGYTLMFASNSAMTAAVALRKQAPYDPLADFTPISMVGRATVFLYVHPAVPAATLKEFVEYARANPGKLNYGTGNPLSILYNVQLMSSTGISMVHVPYKGEGPLNPDILAGRVQSSFLSTGTAVSYAKDGRLRPLAVLLERRSPLLPDVPTITEAGVPAVTVRQWAGMFGPPKMPREIVERLNKEVNAALKRPDVLEKLQGYGYAAEGSTPERLLEINRDDLALWRKLVREAGIPLE
jgi:tripartite-type tricarboxylate transporter receptor subunit TctC